MYIYISIKICVKRERLGKTKQKPHTEMPSNLSFWPYISIIRYNIKTNFVCLAFDKKRCKYEIHRRYIYQYYENGQ